MSHSNRNYGSRGRNYSAGQFVSVDEGPRPARRIAAEISSFANLYPPAQSQRQQQQEEEEEDQEWSSEPFPPTPAPAKQLMKMEMQDDDDANAENQNDGRPPWMKNTPSGVSKLPNRVLRLRQNENLRRLIMPKNALTILNEMLPGETISSHFKVHQDATTPPGPKSNITKFYADLTVEGRNYRGFGENKMAARNEAAEQAIRDLIIHRMSNYIGSGGTSGDAVTTSHDKDQKDDLPMIQLTSFALYKLFSEWECAGHKVPQLHPTAPTADSRVDSGDAPMVPRFKPPKPPKKSRELPPSAATMHPCSLLTYMRPGSEYHEISVEGDSSLNLLFTLGTEVDGHSFVGTATNKKEARKQAAKAACEAIFGVRFEEAWTGAMGPVPQRQPPLPFRN